jgi:hypothetical protein
VCAQERFGLFEIFNAVFWRDFLTILRELEELKLFNNWLFNRHSYLNIFLKGNKFEVLPTLFTQNQ